MRGGLALEVLKASSLRSDEERKTSDRVIKGDGRRGFRFLFKEICVLEVSSVLSIVALRKLITIC